jgi:hypothetical protein
MTIKFNFGTKISKERLAKIIALAEQGIGGEKKNAEEIIQRLLAENKITVADIDESAEETKQLYTLKWEDERSKHLVFLMLKKVVGNKLENIKMFRSHGNAKKLDVMMNPSQYVEFRYLYDLYLEELNKEISALFKAFVFKNDLFKADKDSTPPKAQPNPDEIDRIVKHMKGIDPLNVRKAITA